MSGWQVKEVSVESVAFLVFLIVGDPGSEESHDREQPT